jgi:hypothetical protein
VILLQADHGMRYGNWFKEVEGFQEHKLPALFVIGPESYWERFEHAYDVLHHNSQHLTSKLDERATILEMANELYNLPPPPKSEKLSHAISLVSEKAPTERTCQDADIAPSF